MSNGCLHRINVKDAFFDENWQLLQDKKSSIEYLNIHLSVSNLLDTKKGITHE